MRNNRDYTENNPSQGTPYRTTTSRSLPTNSSHYHSPPRQPTPIPIPTVEPPKPARN